MVAERVQLTIAAVMPLDGEPAAVPVGRCGPVSPAPPLKPRMRYGQVAAPIRPLNEYERATLDWLAAENARHRRALTDSEIGAALGLGGWYDLFHLQDNGQAFEDLEGWSSTAWWVEQNKKYINSRARFLISSGLRGFGWDEIVNTLTLYVYQYARSIRPKIKGGTTAKMLTYFGAWAAKSARVELVQSAYAIRIPKGRERKECGAPFVGGFARDQEDGAIIDPTTVDPDATADNIDHAKTIAEKVRELVTDREWAILRARHLVGETLEKVAKRMGLTRERVRQIEFSALNKVRAKYGVALVEPKPRARKAKVTG